MNYSEILGKAWRITWKNPALWLFGFLVDISGLPGNVVRFIVDEGTNRSGLSGASASVPPGLALALGVAALFGAVLSIAFAILSLISQAALISMFRKIDRGEKPSVGKGFADGAKHFLSMLGITLILGIPFGFAAFILILAIVIPLVISFSTGAEAVGIIFAVLGVVAFLAIIVGAIVVGILTIYSNSFRVIEGTGVFASISKGFGLFRRRIGQSATFWFVMLGVTLLSVIAMLLVALTTLVPAFFAIRTHLISGILLAVPGIILLGFGATILQSFSSGAWTLAFLSMSGLGGSPVGEGIEYQI
ncbi:MAG: hypothetical protein M1335_00715 [Chloroflexi bacterium]|nr:hypothetical protein [Chloroflexota bacterium]